MEVFCILTSIGDVDYEKHLSEVKMHFNLSSFYINLPDRKQISRLKSLLLG